MPTKINDTAILKIHTANNGARLKSGEAKSSAVSGLLTRRNANENQIGDKTTSNKTTSTNKLSGSGKYLTNKGDA